MRLAETIDRRASDICGLTAAHATRCAVLARSAGPYVAHSVHALLKALR